MLVKGTIKDAAKEMPIPKAKVSLSIGDKELAVLYSDRKGDFEYEEAASYIGETLMCQVEKKGYEAQTVTYKIEHDEVPLEIELVKEKNGIPWLKIAAVIGAVIVAGIVVWIIIHYFPAGPPVYSHGTVVIRGTYCCDLEEGSETVMELGDFCWEQVTSPTERYITPLDGTLFHVLGIMDFDSITYSDLKGLAYSSQRINGSHTAANQIPQGTVVAAITSGGRYCKFRIDAYGYDLTISWVTYSRE